MTSRWPLVCLLSAAVMLAVPPFVHAQSTGTGLPSGTTITVRIETGVGGIGTSDLVIDKDIVATTDLFNRSAVRTIVVDNTQAARRDLTFDERTKFFYVGSSVESLRLSDRLSGAIRGVFFAGEQVVAFADPTNKLTEISGNVFGGGLGATVDWRLSDVKGASINEQFEFSFDGSLIKAKDATREPAQTTIGTVTSDTYDIGGERFLFRGGYRRTSPNVTWFVGVERYSNSFDLNRSLEIDFGNVAGGVTAEVDEQLELSKSGWQARADVTYQVKPQFAVRGTAAAGKDAWSLAAGVQLTLR